MHSNHENNANGITYNICQETKLRLNLCILTESSKRCGRIRFTMASKEDLNSKYSPEQIRGFRESRTATISRSIEKGAKVFFTEEQIEKARQEMQQAISLKKARQKIVDYLKGGDPVRQQVVDDVIEYEWDRAFVNVFVSGSTARDIAEQKDQEWSTREAQRNSKIKGYHAAKLNFDYEVRKNYWNALQPFAPKFGERHLQFHRDLKEIRLEVQETRQQSQVPAQQ